MWWDPELDTECEAIRRNAGHTLTVNRITEVKPNIRGFYTIILEAKVIRLVADSQARTHLLAKNTTLYFTYIRIIDGCSNRV